MRNLIKTKARETQRACMNLGLPILECAGNLGFTGEVISLISTSRKHKRSPIYFDYWRFRDGSPSSYDARKTFRFLCFLRKHADKLNRAASLLDEGSRELLKILLAYRALGPVHVALPNSAKLLEVPKAAELLRVAARASQSGTVDVEITTIDQCAFPKVDFIKMDIEGAELSAIRGAKHTIQHSRPRLAISIYHSNSDLFEIALAIKDICANYEFFIDHYTAHAEETVLYATPLIA